MLLLPHCAKQREHHADAKLWFRKKCAKVNFLTEKGSQGTRCPAYDHRRAPSVRWPCWTRDNDTAKLSSGTTGPR